MVNLERGGPWDYSIPDPAERDEKMMTAILGGRDMEDFVENDDERARWRELARSISGVLREGFIPVYGFGALDDDDVE
jgi:hypothetical protein